VDPRRPARPQRPIARAARRADRNRLTKSGLTGPLTAISRVNSPPNGVRNQALVCTFVKKLVHERSIDVRKIAHPAGPNMRFWSYFLG
jgi:hypothetical protein